jgi:hypothetical protein
VFPLLGTGAPLVSKILDDLLHQAERADASDRIELRDPIAAHGTEAIDRVAPWLEDDRLGAFAVRVLEAIAQTGDRAPALNSLRRGLDRSISDPVRGDITAALERLGALRPPSSPKAPSDRLPADAGEQWPGFLPRDFEGLAGTKWRSRDGRESLAPILVRSLRYKHPHFDSYPVERSPELHMAMRERYRQGDEHRQGWRAAKLVVYAHRNLEPPRSSDGPCVTAGLYVERGDGSGDTGPVDDRWDWPLLIRALRDEHVQDELTRTMVGHDLRIGDYFGDRVGHTDPVVGFVARVVEGSLQADDGFSITWDEIAHRLDALPSNRWFNLHIWRSWPATEAMTLGPRFALEELMPVLGSLADVYLDIVSPILPTISSTSGH